MLCKHPIPVNSILVPCGQCMNCRVNKKRIWVTRCALEASCHPYTAFITLTYDEKNLPKDENGVAVLNRRDPPLFFKRLRRAGLKFRYFGVGEYGDQTWRPHYHMLMFGLAPCDHGSGLDCNCKPCRTVRDHWGLGLTSNGVADRGSASYVAGYVTKKMTSSGDARLEGRPPEYSMMSRVPGIGNLAVWDVASALLRDFKASGPYERKDSDVLAAVDIDGRSMPLGKYLRDVLRVRCGRHKGANQATIDHMTGEFNGLVMRSVQNDRSVVAQYLSENEAALVRSQKRYDIFNRSKVL